MEGQAHHAFFVFDQLDDLAPIEKDFAVLLGRVGPIRKDVDDPLLRDDEDPVRAVAGMGDLQRALESQIRKRLFDLQRRQRIGRAHQPGSIDGGAFFEAERFFFAQGKRRHRQKQKQTAAPTSDCKAVPRMLSLLIWQRQIDSGIIFLSEIFLLNRPASP